MGPSRIQDLEAAIARMHSLGTGTLYRGRIDVLINAIVDSTIIRMCSKSLISLYNIRLLRLMSVHVLPSGLPACRGYRWVLRTSSLLEYPGARSFMINRPK
jgi:hypothetical protein